MQIDRPIAIGLIIVITILLIFFLVLPEYNKFKDLQIQLGNKMAEYVAKYDYFSAIDRAYYDLQTRKIDIEKIDSALPKDPVLGRTVYYLQDLAKQNGLIVKSLFLSGSGVTQSENSSGQQQTKDLIFSMALSGSYSSLGAFIASLENSSRIFEVLNISFGSAGEPPYNFSLQIKSYSY